MHINDMKMPAMRTSVWIRISAFPQSLESFPCSLLDSVTRGIGHLELGLTVSALVLLKWISSFSTDQHLKYILNEVSF